MTSQPVTPPGAFSVPSATRPTTDAPPRGPQLSLVADAVTGDAVERLTREFGQQLAPEVISALVAASWRDLAGASVGALPELVERLARQRVLNALPRRPSAEIG